MSAKTAGEEMLPLVVRPAPGENVVGLISRLADAMCTTFSSTLRFLGIRHDFMLRDETWAVLAKSLGLDEKALDGMRREQVVLGRQSSGIRLLGHVMRYFLVVRTTLRVCPNCIAESRPVLEQWDIMHAPVCLRHGNLLVDTCTCGQKLSRRFRGVRTAFSCRCGVRFAHLQAPPASAEMTTFSQMVDDKIKARPNSDLDPALAGLPLSDLICVTHVVGSTVLTPGKEDEWASPKGPVYNSVRVEEDSNDVASIVRLVEAAVPLLLDWDEGYANLLSQVADRNTGLAAASPDALFATRIGRQLRRPPRGVDHIPIPCMTIAVERFCEERHGLRARKISVRRNSPVARKIEPFVSRRRIAKELELHERGPMLARVYEEVVRGLDEQGIAPSLTAKTLAARVKKEVLRRLSITQDTMSTYEAVRYLSHPRGTHAPDDWIHPDLLVPVRAAELGVDAVLTKRRRGLSFLASDVEALRDRICARTQLVTSSNDLDGFEPFAKCRVFHGGGWPRMGFLLAFLNGHIPARSLVERPRMSDIWFHRQSVRNLALEHRVRAMIEKDLFAGAYRCRSWLTELWGRTPDHLSDRHLRHLRRTSAIRYNDVRNTTQGRDRPFYHYSVADLLERALIIQGPTVSPLVDALLEGHRDARESTARIVVDDEQKAANRNLSDLAEQALGRFSALRAKIPSRDQARRLAAVAAVTASQPQL